MIDQNDIEQEYLPEWAISKTKGTNPFHNQFAQLRTKDGRRTGNAVIVEFPIRHGILTIKAVTDAGNILFLTEGEARELFHTPEFVMENLLPAHVDALKQEIHET